MSLESRYNAEVEDLENQLANGFITQQKFNQYIRELEADFNDLNGNLEE